MHAVVIGGTGYIGTRLTSALALRGWNVTAFGLAPGKAASARQFVGGDRRDEASLRRLRRLGDVDAVVDLIAYRPSETRAMVDLWTGSTSCFVHLSTVGVYSRLRAPIAREEMTDRRAPRPGSYGAEKASAERELEAAWKALRFPSVSLRSAPVVGPADPASRENYVLKRILSGRPIIHPPSATGYVAMLYIDDLIQVIVETVERAPPGCRAYHLTQAEPVTLAQHVAAIGRLAGREDVEVEEVPVATLAAHGMRLCGFPFGTPSAERLDIGRAVEELGFSPTPYADALRRTMEWLLPRASTWPAWPGRGSRQSQLCGTHEWIHADQEHRLGTSAAPVLRRTDELLEWLSGVHPFGESRIVATPVARGAQRAAGSGAAADLLVLPVPLVERLAAASVSSLPARSEHRSNGRGSSSRLAGVMEPLRDDVPEHGYLFGAAPPRDALAYGEQECTVTLRFVPFRHCDPASIGAKELVVATVWESADAWAFVDWAAACDARGYLEVPSMPALRRVFLTHLCRWAPWAARAAVEISLPARGDVPLCACAADARCAGEARCGHLPPFLVPAYHALDRDAPGAAAWAFVHDIARLLHEAEVSEDASRARLRLSTPKRPLLPLPDLEPSPAGLPPYRLTHSVLLCALEDAAFAVDMEGSRVMELTPTLVAVAELARRGSEKAASRRLQTLLTVSHRRADTLYRSAVETLTRAGVLERLTDRAGSARGVG